MISQRHSLLQECPKVLAGWEGFPWLAQADLGPEGFSLPFPSTRRRNPRGPARTCRPLQSPASVRLTRRCCPQLWPQQPPPLPWGRSQALNGQPHPHRGTEEGLEGPSRVPPLPQTVFSLVPDPALAPPAQSLGPART